MPPKGGGGRRYSASAPSMRPSGGAKAKAKGKGKGKAAAGGKQRVRPSRIQNAYADDDADFEESLQRYDRDALNSREYRLPDNFQDEELDSDEEGIFDEGDEEKYGEVFAAMRRDQGKGKKGKKGKRSTASTEDEEYSEEVSGDEMDHDDEDEEEEDLSGFEGAETMDLSDMLNMAAPEEEAPRSRSSGKKAAAAPMAKLSKAQQRMLLDEEGEEEDEDEQDEDDDEELSIDEDYDEDEEGGDAHKSLLDFVSGLGAEDEPKEQGKGKDKKAKKSVSFDRTEAFDEDEFSMGRAVDGTSSRGLKLGDLLKRLPGEGEGANVAALKKQFAVLQSAHTSVLVEPLPEVRQEELTRAATYDANKEEVARWGPIINRHRDAPTLKFPLYAQPRQNISSAELSSKFTPSTSSSLEKDLASLLKAYSLKPDQLKEAEERTLAQRNYTDEEVARRQDNLAKMKALLFHQELKARRMNKIKSKSYRRLRKKMREKGQLSLDELKELDPDAYEAEQRKAEQRRIEERMTLQHTHGSKWVKQQLQLAKQSHGANTAAKDALKDHQRVSQSLREKMEAFPREKGSDGESLSEDSEEEEAEYELSDSSDEEDPEKAARKAQEQDTARIESIRAKLRALESELGDAEEDASEPVGFDQDPSAKRKNKAAQHGGDRLLNLKFMQRSADRQREETRSLIRAYEAELAAEEASLARRRERRRQGLLSEDEDEDLAEPADPNAEAAKQHAAGRRKLDAKSSATTALVTGVGEDHVELLPNSLQDARVLGGGSRSRVAQPIAVALPKHSAASKASALPQASDEHPGQHRRIGGKSSVPVDTPFVSQETQEQLFPVEDFSSDEEGEPKPQSVNKGLLDLQKLKHDSRVAAQKAKKAAALASAKGVGVAGQGQGKQAASKQAKPEQMDEEAEDAALDAAADAEEQAQNDEANPWASATAANPRKALREEQVSARRQKRAKGANGLAVVAPRLDEDDDEEHVEGSIDADLSGSSLSLRSRSVEFDLLSSASQADLVKAAFSVAEDSVMDGEEDEFEKMKREAMEEDLPKEETPVTGLPGWGSWGGHGASNWKSPAQLARESAEAKARQARREAALAARADAKLKHVLINQSVDKKALKYQVHTLPYPFTSQEAYEKSLATPVGREWNTTSAFQDKIRPRVITKTGEIIEPVKFNPKVGAAGKQKDGKLSGTGGNAGKKRKQR